jgi:ribosomal protein S13
MARIAGINIPLNKRCRDRPDLHLRIGQSTANQVLERSNVSRTRTCAT